MISAWWLLLFIPLSLLGLWFAIAAGMNWRWVMTYLLEKGEKND